MRLISLALIGIYFIACTNGTSKAKKSFGNDTLKAISPNLIEDSDSSQYLSNDTFCFINLKKFNVKGIQLLKVCHVFYSDSLSRTLMPNFTDQSLPKEYNFDKGDSENLIYTKTGDTIFLKILFLNNQRNTRIAPDSIYFNNGILYLNEREEIINSKKQMKDYKFDEIYYEILDVKNNKNLKIQHSLKLE